MNGIVLEELDTPELVDILHYMFEEDLMASTKEESDVKDEVRKTIYRDLYNTEYLFGISERSSKRTYTASGEFLEDSYDDIVPFDPTVKQERKGYIAPTNFDENSSKPFGDILDGPLK